MSSALLIPIVLGEAWKYAAVMLGSGLIALVLLLVVRRTRPAALAAAEAEELATVLEEAYPECDVELNAGGQPIYYYVISVE